MCGLRAVFLVLACRNGGPQMSTPLRISHGKQRRSGTECAVYPRPQGRGLTAQWDNQEYGPTLANLRQIHTEYRTAQSASQRSIGQDKFVISRTQQMTTTGTRIPDRSSPSVGSWQRNWRISLRRRRLAPSVELSCPVTEPASCLKSRTLIC